MVHNYFSAELLFGVGQSCQNPSLIAESYQQARQMASHADQKHSIIFYPGETVSSTAREVFNLSLFRADIVQAFEEYDTEALGGVFDSIAELFVAHPASYLQAIDAACNILYLSMALLPDGEQTVSAIFAAEPDGYLSLHKKAGTSQVIDWLMTLKEGLIGVLTLQRRTYKNRTVLNVQNYIRQHITERLTLNRVSDAFGISPNYLSMLFHKYSETGFHEFMTQCKIEKAKELMKDSTRKVYEISDLLHFDNAFYFSKVFKKVTGISPKEYMQSAVHFPEP